MKALLKKFENKGQGTIKLDLKYKPGIALVTIDNPTRHNALSGKMMVELYKVVLELEQHTQDIVAVLFLGGGVPIKSFCSGLDLGFARDYLTSPEESLGINEIMYHATEKLCHLPLITLAIATGGSIGGGSELITAFDFICMSKESGYVQFVQTRMGVSSPWGGMHRLIESVGRKMALQWMAGGYKVDAEQGYQAGLVDLVVEKDQDCLDVSLDFLDRFVHDDGRRVSPNAVRGMKQLVIEKKQRNWEAVSKVFAGSTFTGKL